MNTEIGNRDDADARLRRSEHFNRSLMDAIADCVKVLDIDGRLLQMNAPGLCAMEIDDFGPLCGQSWRALWPADARSDIEQSVARAAAGEVASFQAFCPTAKGTPKWWEVTVSPVRDVDGGRVVQLLSVSRDITERKLAAEDLRRRETFIQGVLGSITDGVWAVDKAWRFTYVNDQIVKRFGLERHAIIGRHIWEMFPDAVGTVAHVQLQRAMAERATVEYEVFYEPWQRWLADKVFPTGDGGLAGYSQDVTDRKSADQRLQASEVRYRALFKRMDEGYCVIEMLFDDTGAARDYRLLEVNPAFEAITGLTGAAGKTIRALVPDLEAHWFETYGRVARTGEPVRFANRTKAFDGRWFELYAFRLGEAGSNVVAVLFQDISVRQWAEDALRVSEARFRSLVTATSQIVWTTAADGVVVEDSPTWRAFTGQTLEQWSGWGWLDALHPDDQAATFVSWRQAIEATTPMTAEYRLRRHDGEYRWTIVRAVPIVDEAGVLREWVGTNTDITDRKRGEQALRDSEERYRAATAAVSDVLWTNNADGLMVGEQRGWGTFTGQSIAEYQDFGWAKALHPDDAQPTVQAWTRAVSEKRTFVFEHRVRRHDGEWRNCAARAVPVLNADGTIREWVGVHSDVTERMRNEEELRLLATELSDAHRRKDEFLATLAHELRNPLAPIRNGLQLLRLAGGAESTRQTLSMMERQLRQMVRLVDDLMDISRISQGKIELRKERVQWAAVVESAVETSQALIEQMGHQLTITLPTQPLVVEADLTRLAQVFLNLLNNAAKYSNPGSRITMTAERQYGDVVVSVRDTGIGIATDQLPHIFGMFTQVDRASARAQGGLGIGLSLVKRLVELHGGSVEARSDGPGQGTEFLVRLPIVVEASNPPALGTEDPTATQKSPLRILVVDDNRDAADSLAMLLELMGNDTRTAYDGQQGVSLATEFQPDVALFDIGLPQLNGFEACRRIREQPGGKRIMLIAVTGWGQDDDRRRSQDAGFDLHLVKPLDSHALLKILAGVHASGR